MFVERGRIEPPERLPQLFEIVNPYLDDPAAQAALAEVERTAPRTGMSHRYLYLPSTAPPNTVARYWHSLHPKDTLVIAEDEDVLSGIGDHTVRKTGTPEAPVLHVRTAG